MSSNKVVLNRLMTRIAKRLGIPYEREDRDAFLRILYSAASYQAILAFWDEYSTDEYSTDENDGGIITIAHFKNKIIMTLYAYLSIAKELGYDLKDCLNLNNGKELLQNIADEIFETYWQSGMFYRISSNNDDTSRRRVAVPRQVSFNINSISLLRGVVNDEKNILMSGSGFYCISKNIHEDNIRDIIRSWGFGAPIGEPYLKSLSLGVIWERFDIDFPVEFLQLSKNKYWGNNCPNISFGLARYGAKGNEIYVLFRKLDDGSFEKGKLKFFQYGHPWGEGIDVNYTTKEYLRVACSILKSEKKLPKIEYKECDKLVMIKLGYLLPTAEETFFKLYSWPLKFKNIGEESTMRSNNYDQLTRRVMHSDVFNVFKIMMMHQGFEFQEAKEGF